MKIILSVLFAVSYVHAAPKYNRKEWGYHLRDRKTCLNTRNTILKVRSKIPVIMNKSGCSVASGRWDDYYYPETHTLAVAVDIDHLIPLKHAHSLGAWKWSKKEKKKFATDPENLVITNKVYNQEKKDKTIAEWVPSDHVYACKYLKDWMRIKAKYKLPVSDAEKNSVKNIKECSL